MRSVPLSRSAGRIHRTSSVVVRWISYPPVTTRWVPTVRAVPAALSSFLAAGAFPLGQASDSWVVTTGMLKIVAVFEVDGQVGDHRWQLLNWDGEVLAEKGGYLTRAAALQDIERIRVAAVTANVVES